MSQSPSPKPNSTEPHPLVRIANLEARVSQLEQKLAKLESSQTSIILPSLPTSASLLEDSPDNNDLFEIVSVDTKTIETNDSWSKIAWKLVVKNLSNTSIVFHASIEFLDKDGFIVDDTFESNLLLPAKSQQTYTGYTLIDAPLVPSISSISAKVRLS
jgi:hypothetical protein